MIAWSGFWFALKTRNQIQSYYYYALWICCCIFFIFCCFSLRLFHFLPLTVFYSVILKYKVQRNIHSSHYRFCIASFICQFFFLFNIPSYKQYYKQNCALLIITFTHLWNGISSNLCEYVSILILHIFFFFRIRNHSCKIISHSN